MSSYQLLSKFYSRERLQSYTGGFTGIAPMQLEKTTTWRNKQAKQCGVTSLTQLLALISTMISGALERFKLFAAKGKSRCTGVGHGFAGYLNHCFLIFYGGPYSGGSYIGALGILLGEVGVAFVGSCVRLMPSTRIIHQKCKEKNHDFFRRAKTLRGCAYTWFGKVDVGNRCGCVFCRMISWFILHTSCMLLEYCALF
jgi:hypothetical protein